MERFKVELVLFMQVFKIKIFVVLEELMKEGGGSVFEVIGGYGWTDVG